MKGGSITFNNSETKTNASGSIAEDRGFSLSFGGKNGAPAGKYNVVVSGSGAYGEPETVAQIYGDPLKTPLRQTVADGPNDLTITVERLAKK